MPNASCVLPLTSALEFAEQALVRIGGMDLARVEDCAGEDGSMYIEAGVEDRAAAPG